MEAKLNQLCEKCSSIADHVSMLEKSCSIDPDNPTVYWINHHESSSALDTSVRAGCHLCTLLLAKIKITMEEDMQAQEFAKIDKQAGRLAQPVYQIKLSGYLQKGKFYRKADRLRMSMNPFKSPGFGRSGFKRHIFIGPVLQIPVGDTRHQVAGDTHIRTYTVPRLYIEHKTGKPMTYCGI